MGRKFCQSCSMPLNGRNNGSEHDGTRSESYCELCYADGGFLDPEISVEQMENIVFDVLHEDKHWPGFLARAASRKIPQLDRWKQKVSV